MEFIENAVKGFMNWVRPGRRINLDKVPAADLAEAAKRGVKVDLDPVIPGQPVTGTVNQEVVQDMPTVPKGSTGTPTSTP